MIRESGPGALTITRKVVDGRGRTVAASTSIEEAQIQIGEAQKTIAGRVEHDVKVLKAERRYPDDHELPVATGGLAYQDHDV